MKKKSIRNKKLLKEILNDPEKKKRLIELVVKASKLFK